MKVLVMRHGFAGVNEKWDPEAYAKRALLPEGEDQVRALAQWLDKNDLIPDAIYASDDTTRTMQTAQAVADELFGSKTKWIKDENLSEFKPSEMALLARAQDKGVKLPLLIMHSDTVPRLNHLKGNFLPDPDPIATSELRILKVKRKSVIPSGESGGPWVDWKEKQRVLPSDIDSDARDLY